MRGSMVYSGGTKLHPLQSVACAVEVDFESQGDNYVSALSCDIENPLRPLYHTFYRLSVGKS